MQVIADLVRVMDASKLPQHEIGRLAGYGQAVISGLRTGRNGVKRLRVITDIAEALGYELQLVPIERRPRLMKPVRFFVRSIEEIV